MTPTLTKSQRHRLFLLARLLDKVDHRQFDMSEWFASEKQRWFVGSKFAQRIKELRAHTCGTTACAIGHGLANQKIAQGCRRPLRLLESLGFKTNHFGERFSHPEDPATRLFGPHRKVGPRTVATDIRRYLRTGALPKE
jgi:hypothetical protein